MPIHLVLHDAEPPLADEDLAVLDASDRARAARFVFERDRAQFLLTRVLLRRRLAEHLGVAPEALAWTRGEQGKPGIVGIDPGRCAFSVSHSAGAIAVFIGQGLVGIDIENLAARAFPAEVEHSVFNSAERARLAQCPAPRRSRLAFEWWTRKEAVLKADGRGLYLDPRQIDLSADAPDDTPVRDWSCQAVGRTWFGQSRGVGQDWLCSIAADRPVDREPWRPLAADAC